MREKPRCCSRCASIMSTVRCRASRRALRFSRANGASAGLAYSSRKRRDSDIALTGGGELRLARRFSFLREALRLLLMAERFFGAGSGDTKTSDSVPD